MQLIRRVLLFSYGRIELRILHKIKSLNYTMRERVRGQKFDMGIDRRGVGRHIALRFIEAYDVSYTRFDDNGRVSSIAGRKIQRNQPSTGGEDEYGGNDDTSPPAQNLEDISKIILYLPRRRRRWPFYRVLPYPRD